MDKKLKGKLGVKIQILCTSHTGFGQKSNYFFNNSDIY